MGTKRILSYGVLDISTAWLNPCVLYLWTQPLWEVSRRDLIPHQYLEHHQACEIFSPSFSRIKIFHDVRWMEYPKRILSCKKIMSCILCSVLVCSYMQFSLHFKAWDFLTFFPRALYNIRDSENQTKAR